MNLCGGVFGRMAQPFATALLREIATLIFGPYGGRDHLLQVFRRNSGLSHR